MLKETRRGQRRRWAFFNSLLMVILSTWGKYGFATPPNEINHKNDQFMHHPTFIEELYRTHQIVTTIVDTLTRREIPTLHMREEIEAGRVPIQLFMSPRYAPQEIYRLAEERIEETESSEKKSLTAKEKINIRKEIFDQKKDEIDSQVIEGVAIAKADAPVSKLHSIFSDLKNFHDYVPDIFLESIELDDKELQEKKIVQKENIKFQFSHVEIAHVKFSQTLRYEISFESKPFKRKTKEGFEMVPLRCVTVAWEIDPLFREDPKWKPKGVIMNNGRFMIEPYIQKDGFVDETRSIILYHIYIKIDPIHLLMNILHKLFSGSEARNVLLKLASAMRREAVLLK